MGALISVSPNLEPHKLLRFRVWGFGFRVWGLGFRPHEVYEEKREAAFQVAFRKGLLRPTGGFSQAEASAVDSAFARYGQRSAACLILGDGWAWGVFSVAVFGVKGFKQVQGLWPYGLRLGGGS